jgi:hypothetical protein
MRTLAKSTRKAHACPETLTNGYAITGPAAQAQTTERDLAAKLTEAEKHYDFYSSLCRQYVADPLKLAIYMRQTVTRPELRDYLAQHHPEDLAFFESVLAESEGKVAGS